MTQILSSQRFSTRSIPQADTLDNVIDVLEFVKKGHNSYQAIAKKLGLTERQGRYYRLAAEILGFIRNIKHRNMAILTQLGQDFLNANHSHRQQILTNQVLNIPVVQGIIAMIAISGGSVIQDELNDALLTVVKESTRSMIRRRIKTIVSWLETLGIVTKTERIIKLQSLPGTIEKLEIGDPNMPVIPRVDDLKLFRLVLRRTSSVGTLQYEMKAVKQERADETHERLRSCMAKRLREHGYVPTSNHYVDLATRINESDFLIEVKTLGTDVFNRIREGVSQLYEYRYIQCLPHAKLVLLLDRPLTGRSAWLLDYLEKDRGIYVMWNGDNGDLQTTKEGYEALPFMGSQ